MKVSVAAGVGVGPEIMASALEVFAAAAVPLEFVEESGQAEPTGVLFRGPTDEPDTRWAPFADKRVFSTLPGVPRKRHQAPVDLTLIRESAQDAHGAIEHMQTHDVAQSRRLVTRPGAEQMIRYAFDVASRKGARRVTCGHNASVMKLTDGMFLEVFREVAGDFPELQADERSMDTLAMELVMHPEAFDVVVLPGLHGDLVTDLCAGLVGGLAYVPSAQIGENIAIFGPVHGPHHELAGLDRANPTALLLAGCVMLRHLGLVAWADRIEDAVQEALIDAFRAPDLCEPPRPFSTRRFTARVVDVLEAQPAIRARPLLLPIDTQPRDSQRMMVSPRSGSEATVGVDLFIDSASTPTEIAVIISDACKAPMRVTMICNRGVQVWPTGPVFTDCVNHHRVRVESDEPLEPASIFQLAAKVSKKLRVCSLEALLRIGDDRGYSLAQGQ